MSKDLSDADNGIAAAIFDLTGLALYAKYEGEVYEFDGYILNRLNNFRSTLKGLNECEWNNMPRIWRWKSKVYRETLLNFFCDLVMWVDFPHGINKERLDEAVGYLSGSINDPLLVSNVKDESKEMSKRIVLNRRYVKLDIRSPVYRFLSLGR